MKMLVLNKADVGQLLPMDVCMDLVAEGLVALCRDEGLNPLRLIMWLPDKRGLLGLMPAYVSGKTEALGVKVVSNFPGNFSGEFDSHQGGVLMFDSRNGSLKALIDAGGVTAIRTAAASGVCSVAYTLGGDARGQGYSTCSDLESDI